MKNLILQPAIRQKIDRRVDKILRDLGDPEPPLRLEEVRELLRLHVSFYQTDSDGIMKRAIHSLVMAGKQIFARPSNCWMSCGSAESRLLSCRIGSASSLMKSFM